MGPTCFLLSILLVFGPSFIKAGVGWEEHLERHLFANYSSNSRPVVNGNDTVYVGMTFLLAKIEKLDEKNQLMVSFGWLIQDWHDIDLEWIPLAFGGIEAAVWPAKLVWRPEVSLFNSIENMDDLSFTTNSRVRVYHTGDIEWIQGLRWVTKCEMNLRLFPFDTQVCNLTFINWVHTAALVDFYNLVHQVILDSYDHNPEWNLIKSVVYSEHINLNFSEEIYPVAGFSLTLKRVPTYYVYNIIAPVLLLTLLSCLVYVMPAEAGEKVGLQITILLSFSVMLLIMGDVTPKAGKTTPQITLFIISIMALISTSLVITVCILNIYHHTTDNTVPRWIKVLVMDWIATMLCMKCGRPKHQVAPRIEVSCEVAKKMDTKVKSVPFLEVKNGVPAPSKKGMDVNLPDYVRTYIFQAAEREAQTAISEENKSDWQIVGRVLDRLFLFIFLAIMIIISVLNYNDYRNK